ncbi:MAG: aminotransferase class IV [Bacteroidales bacterium]|nr:aminotransferase class IV [Bacteroidales bacterium]
MSLLLESIRFENNRFHHLDFHQERMNRSARELLGSKAPELEKELENRMDQFRESNPGGNQCFKFRVLYDQEIRKVEWAVYQQPTIRSLKMVEASQIDYSHKYADREVLNELLMQRGRCDDILMIKEGRITDTSFCNVVFYNEKQWLTPAYPLLKGVQREVLLKQEIIQTADIRVEDLGNFSKLRLINALLPFEKAPELKISQTFS